MGNVQRCLDERVTAALRAAYPEAADAPAVLLPAQDPRFGDYQANGAMGLAKRLGKNPREVAAAIVERLDVSDLSEPPETAGPGFINFRLKADWVGARLGEANAGDRLGVPKVDDPETVVVDYSAPNLAKEMHVGHLRSTIIGDALVRMLDFQGHDVERQNHVGDWGTQFGMIILSCWHRCMAEKRSDFDYIWRTLNELKTLSPHDSPEVREAALRPVCQLHQQELDEDPDGKVYFDSWVDQQTQHNGLTFAQLEEGYRFVDRVENLAEGTNLTITHRPSDRGPVATPLANVSSRITAMMQAGGEKNLQELKAWQYAKQLSFEHCSAAYQHLGVSLTPRDIRGESAYNEVLPDIVDHLLEKGLLTESEGARCVFLTDEDGEPLFKNKKGEPQPLIVQKSDEGYLYATTDLAALAFRTGHIRELPDGSTSPQADRILYVVDARQSLHFRMLFECAYQAGFADRDQHDLVHVAFGTMMGEDRRPFKTREGGTVKLMGLLKEARKRAYRLVTEKNAADAEAGRAEPLSEEERTRIAHIVGIGAVKYADLSQNRTSDYVFSWDKMLSLQGNTAPYMQYACARVRSIFRKGAHEPEALRSDASAIPLTEDQERALGVAILRLSEVLDRALEDYRPNVLAAYLYDLAGAFTAFYEACPVLKSDEPTRTARLKLCDLTARTIARGLGLLGIETAERM